MDDYCQGPVTVLLYNPEPVLQQLGLLWGYAFGLATLIPAAALLRWWR